MIGWTPGPWRGWRESIRSCCRPVKHRSAQAQADLTVIRARASLVRARTALVNAARGLTKSYGERLRGCNPRNLDTEKAQALSPELQAALGPLLQALESLSERITEYNQQIEAIAQQSYPQTALLKQIKGVGTLIALTYMLTLEDPHRFRKSRDAGCYVGLQPGRRNSGQSEPQMHISKEGDPYLRTLLVQGAHHILGPFGADSDLRRWGLKLAERGGKAERNEPSLRRLASWRCCCIGCGSVEKFTNRCAIRSGRCRQQLSWTAKYSRSPKPSSGDCVYCLAHFYPRDGREVAKQVAAPAETRTPNLHRASNRSSRVRMEGWRQWRLGGEKPCLGIGTDEDPA